MPGLPAQAVREVPADADPVACSPEEGMTDNVSPVGELPEHVQAEEGQFTAFADFENAELLDNPKWLLVPMYLVNQTDKHFDISMEDGSAYFMLEVQVEGEWVRAQTHHFSGCGNSYYTYRLEPGEFVQVNNRFQVQADGETAAVPAPARFRRAFNTDQPMATNIGQIRYSPEAIEDAHHDALWVATADAPAMVQLIQGEIQYTPGQYEPAHVGVMRAIDRLGKLGQAEHVPLLIGVAMEGQHGVSTTALDALAELGVKAEPYLPVIEAWFRVLQEQDDRRRSDVGRAMLSIQQAVYEAAQDKENQEDPDFNHQPVESED